jgi:hypothetical protein
MVAVKEDRLVVGVGQHGGGVFKQVGNGILSRAVVGAAVITDWNMNPSDSKFGGLLAFLNRKSVISRMSQREDGLDLVIANDSMQRPWLLPGTAKDSAWLDGHEMAREDVVVSMPPELLPADPHRPDQERSPNPGTSVDHRALLPQYETSSLAASIVSSAIARPSHRRGRGIVAGDRIRDKSDRIRGNPYTRGLSLIVALSLDP